MDHHKRAPYTSQILSAVDLTYRHLRLMKDVMVGTRQAVSCLQYHLYYSSFRVTAAMCKRATSALQQGLPPLYEITVAALMITSISKS
ncbi:hypothetical protein T4B_3570 [Trichinella pseudospiralis]|uniref:Uncharacterized protein n=1 Tax=Trichinella pseudospiralis TaxID=6337 RepID=A0A0V1GNH6_TRIPS|nr:hypothetical protein T4B_3570 [Trichinella pseudospiralis]